MLLSLTYLLFILFLFLAFFPYSSSSIRCSTCLMVSFELMYPWKLEYRLWRMHFCTDISGTATLPACVCTFVCSPGFLFTAFSLCSVFIHPPATGASPAAPSWLHPVLQWLTQRLSYASVSNSMGNPRAAGQRKYAYTCSLPNTSAVLTDVLIFAKLLATKQDLISLWDY